MSLEHVKAFYKRLATDKTFSDQIQNVKSKEECSQIVKTAGYNFTLDEYEEYTAQLLESSAEEGELQDLSEKELATVFGGISWIGSFPLPFPIDPIPTYGHPPQPLIGIAADLQNIQFKRP